MKSREVICYACNHQFRENLIDDECSLVRSSDGTKLEVDIAQCPKCGKLMYITRDSLIGLDTDQYEHITIRLS